MSNSSNDVKSSKPVFSYARAAQGTKVNSTTTAPKAQPNGKQATATNDTTESETAGSSAPPAAAAHAPAAAAAAATPVPVEDKKIETETATRSVSDDTNRSSVSGASAAQQAWSSDASGVHMPPRTTPAVGNATSSVQFGNFGKPANSPAQKSPLADKAASFASGGIAPPPAIQGKDVPQFGSIPSAPSAADNMKAPTHSRSNSNASEFRPSTMSPNPQYPMGNYQGGGQYNQFPPAVPNFNRARGGSNANQYGARGGARNVQGPRNTAQSPMNSPQQPHAMGSPMGSPAMYGNQNYAMPQQHMYSNYGGYPPQFGGYNPGQTFQPHHLSQQNYMNPQANRNHMNYGQSPQYQNPNLQAPTAASMSRSGSTASERPPSSMNTTGIQSSSTPVPSAATPAFTTPRKKGSSAIRIVDPKSKNEVVLPKISAPAEPKRESTASPAPKVERTLSTGPNRPSSASSIQQPTVETAEQRKAKQEATRQAILEKIAASKAAEQAEVDRKAKEGQDARDAEVAAAAAAAAAQEQADTDARAKAAEEAKEAEEKAKLAAEAAEIERAKAAEAAALELKSVEEAKAKKEATEREEAEEAARQSAQAEAKASAEAALAEEEARASESVPESGSDEVESTDEVAVAATAPKSEESGGLDTIVETLSAGQTEDVIETKSLEASTEDVESADPDHSSDPAGNATTGTKKKSSGAEEAAVPEKAVLSPMTASLRSSKRITDMSVIAYPSGINGPSKDINKNSKDGKIKYDKEFLLQFQRVFVDKPTFDWDETIKSAMRDSDSKSGKGAMGGRSGSNRGAAGQFGGLPVFNAKPLKSSDERFQQSEKMRAQGIDPAAALSGPSSFERGSNFKPTIPRKDSINTSSPRTESKRGGKGGGGGGGGRITSNRPEKAQIGAPTIAPEDVKPLANSGTRWTPKRAAEAEPLPGSESTAIAPDVVQRKVKGLLNKLTLDNFDRITDQILDIASQSKDEADGRTLRQVIALTFEKATDEAHFSNMYARFCRKMMDSTSDEVKDEGITDKHGNQVVGGFLFRKYLLSRCQEDFERGWKTDLPPKPDGEPQNEEAAMLSDEYYIAAAAKRRGLGLVRFIGELFLLQMLNEKIMQECIRKLLANVTDPEEEEVESLSKLVETVGSALDQGDRGREVMNVYMQRMQQLTACETLSSRIKFMVLDVLDLRKAGWVGSKTDKGPKTIQQIHDDAAQAAALKESQRGPSHRGGMGGGGGGRPDFGRGDARNMSRRQESHGPSLTTGADGWSTLKGAAPRDTRAGDLTKFGKFNEKRTASTQSSFGPGGNLSQSTRTASNQASRNPSHSGLSREDSRISQAPTNPFAALEGESGDPSESAEQPSAESSAGRPRLNLLPKGATDGSEPVTGAKGAEEGEVEEGTGTTSKDEATPTEEAESIPMPGDE